MFRRKENYAYGTAPSAFTNKKGITMRTRPENIKFNRGSKGEALASRGEWAKRLKGARKTDGKRAALALKRDARKRTFLR